MQTNMNIPLSDRIKRSVKEWAIDYLIIILLLVAVAIIFSIIYFVMGRIPEVTELQSNVLAFFTSIVPVIILFSYTDYHGGSYGKKRAGIELMFEDRTAAKALLRNIIKFIPWQLGHMSTISGIYSNYESLTSQILTPVSVGLLLLLIGMRLFRQDGRHLGDMLAGTSIMYIGN